MTKHKIINTNSNNIQEIQNNSVHLIVTSPPYPMIEMWDEMFCNQDKEIEICLKNGNGHAAFEKMHKCLEEVWKECDRVLCNSGFICINIGDATRTINDHFQLYPNHCKIIEYFSKLGYSVLPDIHWCKQSNSPNKFMGSGMYPAGAYVTYEHEYILIFRKGGKRNFQNKEKEKRQKSAYFWEERNVWFSDIWEIKGTSQNIKTKNATRNRNASYPFEIPYRLINMYSIEGDTVLDPFCGLGTTSLACMAANRNSIGIELDASISKLAMERLLCTPNDLNTIIDNRIENHKKFMETLSEEKQIKCYKNDCHDFLVKTKQETKIKIQKVENIECENDIVICKYQ